MYINPMCVCLCVCVCVCVFIPRASVSVSTGTSEGTTSTPGLVSSCVSIRALNRRTSSHV